MPRGYYKNGIPVLLNKHWKLSEKTKKRISEGRLRLKQILGYLNSPEANRKNSEAHKGKKYPNRKSAGPCLESTKRKMSKAHKGKITSEKTRRKQSEANRGEKSYLWQGGKSFEPYGVEFNNQLREQIRNRDGYRCQECFRHQDELFTKTGRRYKLIVHHIDYNKRNNNLSNLISLCRNCHAQTMFNREDWTDYFKHAR